MSARRAVVLGASAFPKIAEILRAFPDVRVDTLLDDDPRFEGASVAGVPVRGPLTAVHDAPLRDHAVIFAIGSWRTRLARFDIVRRLAVPRERWLSLVHPGAQVFDGVRVGAGCIVHAGAVVLSGSVLDDFVILSPHALIGDDNHLGEGALVGGNATTTAGAKIGPYVHLGAASCVGEGVSVGAGAQVGIGSVVLRDVPPGAFVLGNPARVAERFEVPEALLAFAATCVRER
jgi:sugar O-acyltransferase (sialic acid O-acetyltransferase NeuD family)